jgi:hypothetical protein
VVEIPENFGVILVEQATCGLRILPCRGNKGALLFEWFGGIVRSYR